MTDKEKEAIEKLKETSKQCHNSKECWEKEDCPDCYVEVEDIFAIEIVLKLIQTQQAEIEKKDKMIDKIQKEVRDHIGFENRLKRDNKEPDLFNQGRFYVANNINNILKGKVENGN